MAAMRRDGVKSQEELIACIPEPDPDYVEEEGDGAGSGDALSGDFPPPPPPLTAEQLSEAVAEAYEWHVQNGGGGNSKEPPSILPKPLHNPCVESRERQALHKELLLNYKIGKDVLQKPELNKVMRERRETQRKKEWEDQKSHKGRTSLELKLEERANRMKEEEDKESMKVINEEEQAPEFMRMHRKITLKSGGSEVNS